MKVESVNFWCAVDKKDIAFINAVFEWYHEIAVVRTKDKERGIIELWIAPDFLDEALKAIEHIKKFVNRFEILKTYPDYNHILW
jgi:hypothetical protein